MTKQVLFKVALKGHGIVNFDSKEQKWLHFNLDKTNYDGNNNVMYGKKRWYKNDDKIEKKLVISSECLKRNIFVNDLEFQNSGVIVNKYIFNKYIASIPTILRGYLFAGSNTYKKKSAIMLHEAEQTNGAIPTLEFFSVSGKKDSKEDEDDKSGTSIYKKETVGEISYETKGIVDL
jgi:hypothetical protein